jgi:hypothetical protein
MTSIRFLRFSARCLTFTLVAASLVSCGSSGSGGGGGTPMTDANNYMATQHQLNIPTITAKSGSDLTIDWSGIMQDLLCHTAKPIQSLTFAQIPLRNKTVAQVEDELATGAFNPLMGDAGMYWMLNNPTGTTTMLSSLTSSKVALNPATDFVPMTNMTYLLAFADTTNVNQGAESMVFLTPDATSSNTTVTAPDACTGMFLTFAATLGQPLTVPNKSPYKIDWSAVTKDGFGNQAVLANIDKIEIAYYQGKTADYLQSNFKDVEIDATTLYSATDVNGNTSYDLTHAKTAGGQAFSGFTPTDGVWAMALLNSRSSVPAPIAFTILTPQ